MPIIRLCEPTDEGATGHHYGAGGVRSGRDDAGNFTYEGHGPRAYWTRLSHVGLCIRDYERNGYHDSDFHMIVWNPEKLEPEDILFASTRGWSYPCYGSSPDATPEVMGAYWAWERKRESESLARSRRGKADALRRERRLMIDAAKTLGFNYHRLLIARRRLGAEKFAAILWLLTAKVRSGFKLSMRQQVVAWMQSAEPKYPTPLSAKQIGYLSTLRTM